MSDLERLRKKSMALPEQPGVYIMKNSSAEIIYIGKAKILKNRVSQYFGSKNNHTEKVRRMVENVYDFDYITVSTEYEALVLECNLIKLNKPKYNILLKDSKGYSYIKITDSDCREISAVKQTDNDRAEFLGPFMSSEYSENAVEQAKDIFMLPHCSKKFPKEININKRPCLNYHLKLCSGLCAGKISVEEHNCAVEDAVAFLKGDKKEYVRKLEAEMNEASENLDFEKAAKIRDRIKALKRIRQKQNVVCTTCKNQDVFGISSIGEKSCLCVLNFRDGALINTDTYIFDAIDNPDEEYAQILGNYYSSSVSYPERIVIDYDLPDSLILEQTFSDAAKHKVKLYYPKAGEGKILSDMAKKNAGEKLSRALSGNNKKLAALNELMELFGMSKTPAYIESYDISNLAGEENVAGMIVFENGLPLKKAYRNFEIKSFFGQDDYRSMAEVITRRINEYDKAETEDGFGKKPDLILLDGGTGQVNAVMPVIAASSFADVPVFGMVKDNKHRTRAIASGGKEITINDNRSVFTLISDIQEEVHRRAVGYHRTLRRKHNISTTLTNIPGIGEKRAKNLLIRFKTIDAIKKADIEDLMKTPGITADAAQSVFRAFHPE